MKKYPDPAQEVFNQEDEKAATYRLKKISIFFTEQQIKEVIKDAILFAVTFGNQYDSAHSIVEAYLEKAVLGFF